MAKLTSMHFYGWKSGLKTGMYYLRTKSAVDAIKFTLDNKSKENTSKVEVATNSKITQSNNESTPIPVEPLSPQELKQMLSQAKDSEDDDCLMCGS